MSGKLRTLSGLLVFTLVLGIGSFLAPGQNSIWLSRAYAETVTVDEYGTTGGYGENGGDVSLNNAASGTTDPVRLYQNAYGGYGGNGGDTYSPGKGGDASSILTGLTLPGATSTTYEAKAYGGAGGQGDAFSSANGGVGGNAQAGFNLTGEGNISGTAFATGGAGGGALGSGNGGAGGTASLDTTMGPVYGESTNGGNVNVNVQVTMGSGGNAVGADIYSPSAGSGGNGASISLNNVVDGNTTGNLTLYQSAVAGSSGGTNWTSGNGGQAGSAESVLSKSKATSSLDLGTYAAGGSGGTSYGGNGTDGKQGTASTEATNTGDALASATAGGGNGGSSALGGAAGQAGAAFATARATSTASYARSGASARGGDGGSGSQGRAGGAAEANAEAITAVPQYGGGSYFYGGEASSNAYGGAGGHGVNGGGAGGAATAQSTYTYDGSESASASVSAGAQGGTGGQSQKSSGGAGGNATANANGYAPSATGLSVNSGANGGAGGYSYSGDHGQGGEALATSTGTAASGLVNSDSRSWTSWAEKGDPDGVTAQTSAAIINGTSKTVAGTNVGEITKFLADTGGYQGAAFGTALPTQTSLTPLLASNPQVQAAFSQDSTVLGYGVLGRTSVGSSETTYTSSLENFVTLTNISNPGHLLVGLLDSSYTGSESDFSSLQFQIRDSIHPDPLYSQTFSSASAALAFFDDRVLDLGLLNALINTYGFADLTFSYSLVAAEGASFTFNFIEGNVSTVPVPASVLLLGTGLLGLGAVGWRRRKQS